MPPRPSSPGSPLRRRVAARSRSSVSSGWRRVETTSEAKMGEIGNTTEKPRKSTLLQPYRPKQIIMELRDLVRNDVAAVAEQVLWGSVLFRKALSIAMAEFSNLTFGRIEPFPPRKTLQIRVTVHTIHRHKKFTIIPRTKSHLSCLEMGGCGHHVSKT
jgi:hypothetical protein